MKPGIYYLRHWLLYFWDEGSGRPYYLELTNGYSAPSNDYWWCGQFQADEWKRHEEMGLFTTGRVVQELGQLLQGSQG